MVPRIAPLDPPYRPELQAQFDKLMHGAPPLALFRTVARNPRVLQRMMDGGLLDRGSIALRARELMILCALRLRVRMVELIMLAGLYHAVSFATNALGIQHEAFAPRFPTLPD